MKCDICRNRIEETFLKKIIGTYVKDSGGKRKTACPECQKKFRTRKELLAQL